MLAVILVAMTLLVGVVLFIVWLRLPNPVKGIIEKVKAREMLPPATSSSTPTPPTLGPAPIAVAGPSVQVNVIEAERKP